MNKILKKNLRRVINLWPPFLGAGIGVTRWDPDWRAVDVEMKLRRWNRNYVGTHYGGSLYSMVDPFYMVMLIENLGREYIVWDKSASIRFRKPGRGTVRAEFRLTEGEIEEIKRALEREAKIEREFGVEVKDESGEVVAEVRKLLHFRRKDTAGIEKSESRRGAYERKGSEVCGGGAVLLGFWRRRRSFTRRRWGSRCRRKKRGITRSSTAERDLFAWRGREWNRIHRRTRRCCFLR